MKALSREQLATLSRLLDEALDVEPSARAAWLASATTDDADLAERLRLALRMEAAATSGANTASSGVYWIQSGSLSDLLVQSSDPPRFGGLVPQPGTVVDRYRLIRRLGGGGMGEVWLAERVGTDTQHPVALKLPMHVSISRKTAERFTREQRILARLSHRNIAALQHAGFGDHGLPYLVMEYVDGVPITDYCNAHKLGIGARITLFRDVLAAVAYAHAQLIIHRDIKPSNVMVDQAGEVKLLDFGVAKLLVADEHETDHLTREVGVAVTANYASPEQLQSLVPTVSTDVYSLGVLLYELLTNVRPYNLRSGEGIEALRKAHIIAASRAAGADAVSAQGAPNLRAVQRALAGDIGAVVMKALEFERTRRYQTVAEFAEDLARAERNEPVHAVAAGKRYVARKFAARHWRSLSAAGAVFLAVLIGAGVTTWQTTVARSEARRAQTVEAFLLRVFDANAYDQQDVLHAEGSTARELLDNGVKAIDGDANLKGAALREVLSVLATANADLGARREALELGVRALAVERELAEGPKDRRATLALRLTVADAALLTNQRDKAVEVLSALDSAYGTEPELFLPSQLLMYKALRAFMVRDSDWPRAAVGALDAMTSVDAAADDRYLNIGVQRLADVYEQRHDLASHRMQELALALTLRRYGTGHPRTTEARLRAMTVAASVGEISTADAHMQAVKLALAGEANPSDRKSAGWWISAARNAMDSPVLMAAAVAFSRFEIDYGTPGQGVLDAAVATTIAARLRSGQDKSLLIGARTAYAEVALRSLRLELADVHTRAALAVARERRDELAALAADLRADYLTLQGDASAARGLLAQANAIRQELGTHQRPRVVAHRLLREAGLANAQGFWADAHNLLDQLDQHLGLATYATRRVDARRSQLLRADAHVTQASDIKTAKNAANQASNPVRSASHHLSRAAELLAEVTSANTQQDTSPSAQRHLGVARLLQGKIALAQRETFAACTALVLAVQHFRPAAVVSGSGLVGAALAQPGAQDTCQHDPAGIHSLARSRGDANVLAESLSPASPMREGRLVYALF